MLKKINYKFEIGEIVKCKENKYVGEISERHRVCPMTAHWLYVQTTPVKKNSIFKPWYTINVLKRGVVCIPEYDLEGYYNDDNSKENLMCEQMKEIKQIQKDIQKR